MPHKVREGFRAISTGCAKRQSEPRNACAQRKSALIEIDRERCDVSKLRKEVDEISKRADRREVDHRRAVEAVQVQLGDARHQTDVLQGRLDAMRATNVRGAYTRRSTTSAP